MEWRVSDSIVVGYFVLLLVAALFVPTVRHRGRVVAVSLAVVACVLSFAFFPTFGRVALIRDWSPLAYLLLGYWLPALFVVTTNLPAERALLAADRRWFGTNQLIARTEHASRALLEILELAYLACYVMVPAGFVLVYVAGARIEVDRFWTAVLIASFLCFGLLPWLPTRPPRTIQDTGNGRRLLLRSVNLHVLDRGSCQLNTFPSAHAAAACATALTVAARWPLFGIAFAALAVAIVIGSVVGRYHRAVDAATGAAVGVIGFVASRLVV